MRSVISAAEAAVTVLLVLINMVPATEAAQSPRSPLIVVASATEIHAPPDDQAVELADRAMRV
jgi:hypothetical protein